MTVRENANPPNGVQVKTKTISNETVATQKITNGTQVNGHKQKDIPYGKRLIVQTADELARSQPERIYATVSRSATDLADGFRDVTIREFVNAVNFMAWWIEERIGRSETFEVVAYMGVSDIRYAIVFFALVKCGYVVSPDHRPITLLTS